MECLHCKDKNKPLQCERVLLDSPIRLDQILVRLRQWECPACDWNRAIYAKQPLSEVRQFTKTVSCLCCNDTGVIYDFHVQKFLMPEYLWSDPQVICRRCQVGSGIKYAWDIATKQDCEQIHNHQLAKLFREKIDPNAVEIALNKLSQSMSM